MYVNETLDPFPTIYAENDPEGFVHYLFGIEYDGDIDAFNEGMRKLNADIRGGEFEVFVYYGKVRYSDCRACCLSRAYQ